MTKKEKKYTSEREMIIFRTTHAQLIKQPKGLTEVL
jgi:hypothetical protein